MAYNLKLKCANNCGRIFQAKSNAQIYCPDCKPLVRKAKNGRYQHDYYIRNQSKKLQGYRAYNKSEKGKAAQAVRDAVRRGQLVRQPCEVCAKPKAQGHHEDYSKPLEVRWLCPTHHREAHLYEPWQNEMRHAGYKGGFLLGQLIEAFGDDVYFSLNHIPGGKWIANYAPSVFPDRPNGALGESPEEATANAWLSLHVKEKSEWYVNSKQVSKEEYEAYMESLSHGKD